MKCKDCHTPLIFWDEWRRCLSCWTRHGRDASPRLQRFKGRLFHWALRLSAGGGLAWWIIDAVSHLLTGTKHGASGW